MFWQVRASRGASVLLFGVTAPDLETAADKARDVIADPRWMIITLPIKPPEERNGIRTARTGPPMAR